MPDIVKKTVEMNGPLVTIVSKEGFVCGEFAEVENFVVWMVKEEQSHILEFFDSDYCKD